MTDHDNSYRVVLTNDVCYAKRAVSFRDARSLDWDEVKREVFKHFTSQNCHRCGKVHPDSAYVVTSVEMGEPDWYGGYDWQDVYPDYPKVYNTEASHYV